MDKIGDVSRIRAWLIAARPHTLPAAASPVIVGTGLALHDGVFAPVPALAALIGAGLIQVGTNLANDYYDGLKGADVEADGFTRVTESGLIPPGRVKWGMVGTFGLAVLVGVYLVYRGGVPILLIGLASIASGILYTGGPYPFGYHGLGDLFTFVFFGLIAVTGTYYVQAVGTAAGFPIWIPPGSITREAVVASLPMAALITNILVVNNIRDLESDQAVGKRTLAVIIGYTGSRLEFVILLGLAYVVPIWFLLNGFSVWVLLPALTIPYAAIPTRTVLTRRTGQQFNAALERAGRLVAIYAITFATGLAL